MNQERLLKILKEPRVTEKSTMVGEVHGQYVFRVVSDATKPEIKKAVEKMFGVEVDSVSVLNVKGKTKKFGRRQGRRGNWKKAYVSLGKGQELNFTGV